MANVAPELKAARKIGLPIPLPGGAYAMPRLARTTDYLPEGYLEDASRTNFYDALKAAAVASAARGMIITPSDAGEAQRVYVSESRGAARLEDVDALQDYFAGRWEFTLTGLRFREQDVDKVHNIGDKITALRIETDITGHISTIADPGFKRENFRDIISEIDRIEGEVRVPYARGDVIANMQNGIFTEISPGVGHATPYALHGWLPDRIRVDRDPISGGHDVAVERGCSWRRAERCLGVGAGYRRWDAVSGGGFRPVVRGSLTPDAGLIKPAGGM